jgi:hypothetical protein
VKESQHQTRQAATSVAGGKFTAGRRWTEGYSESSFVYVKGNVSNTPIAISDEEMKRNQTA